MRPLTGRAMNLPIVIIGMYWQQPVRAALKAFKASKAPQVQQGLAARVGQGGAPAPKGPKGRVALKVRRGCAVFKVHRATLVSLG